MPNPFQDDRLTDAGAFDPSLDVPTLHQSASDYLYDAIVRVPKMKQPDGRAKIAAILSIPGVGKTHVVGRVQHRIGDNAVFVFVPQVEDHGSPIRHVQWHLLRRLFESSAGERPLLHVLLARLCQHSFRQYFSSLPHTVKEQHKEIRDRLEGKSIDPILEIVDTATEPAAFIALGNSLAARYPGLNGDVVRALALGWSSAKDDAWRWLRGEQVNEKRLVELKLPTSPPDVASVLRTLTGLLHPLKLPVFICCDQSEKMLKFPSAMSEFTTALMGWVDSIPNLVLAMTFLRDEWKHISENYKSFFDRTKGLELEALTSAQAVELVSKRIAAWPGARPDRGATWPILGDSVVKLAATKPLFPRLLLKSCAAALDGWLHKQSLQPINVGEKNNAPLEELLRQEWTQTLAEIRKKPTAPGDVQEERLFRAARECLAQLQVSKSSASGVDILQLQEDAIHKQFALHVKLGVGGTNDAFPVVLAVTKLQGGRSLSAFLSALKDNVSPPVVGAVLIRPHAKMTLGPSTDGRKTFDEMKATGRLRLYDLDEHLPAFDQMECYLRLLDRAGQKELLLGQQTLSVDQFRQLAARTKLLEGLDLIDTTCAGWVRTPANVAANASAPVQTPIPAHASVPVPSHVPAVSGPAACTLPQTSPGGNKTAIDRPPVVPAGPAPSDASVVDGNGWADHLLAAISKKLNEFGQRVEPRGVQMGPTFARFMMKPLGRTSVGKVRNHANDLRTHIAAITDVPVITDQPGFISIDVRRPDRKPVRLAEHQSSAPAEFASQPAFPVGVDVAGKPAWLNLADPSSCHILAAGTTGSGKSEFLKAMIASLALRLSPLEIQFVLIDPKRVTFNLSANSPYLPRPAAYTVEEAMPLVQECFAETERRYRILQEKGLEHVGQLTGRDALPRIVVVFDEFADLMAERETKRELEGSLKRIGALARAAGIHLVLATQRPDRDVVTPLLRANLPARICLRVDSERNSKLILDDEGGENLLGHGDLFWKHGSGLMRLQGLFVPKAELEQALRMEGQ